MKLIIRTAFILTIIISCVSKKNHDISRSAVVPLTGTWKLIKGTTIEKGDTVEKDYTNNVSFIKIINETHFAFLLHDLNKGKDTAPVFTAGGGSYSLRDSLYTEHLEYCSDRNWEGNDFKFIIHIQNDTLIQSGVEKVESAAIERINIEKYIRVKK